MEHQSSQLSDQAAHIQLASVFLYGSETWMLLKRDNQALRHVTCAANIAYWAYLGLTVLLMLKCLLYLAYWTSHRSSREDGMLSLATYDD